MNKHIIDLYLYYATLEKPDALNIQIINKSFNKHTQFLENLGYQVKQIKEINSLLLNFVKSVDDFDKEMKSSQRDWDVLREILQNAQIHANKIDSITQDICNLLGVTKNSVTRTTQIPFLPLRFQT